ncbi:MAG: hypothetical protein HQM07_07865 [Zetaproteobacteria bacterium]|nr:hypothetical protein [Zetaproteobacteria bacterium]
MAIENNIKNYLSAVERAFGIEAKNSTILEHKGGNMFLLKRHTERVPSIVDMQTVNLMTSHLHSKVAA